MPRGPCLLICLLATAANQPAPAARLHLVEGRPVVDGVFVNNHGPYRFLVDTATTSNHIEPTLARSIGLVATFRTPLTSSVGTVIVPGADGVEIALAPVHAGGQQFLFAGMDVIHQLDSGIQGILGQDFLSRFDYLLDLRGRRLEFGPQELPGSRAAFRLANGRTAVPTSLGDLVLDSGTQSLILFGVQPEGNNGGFMRTLAGSLFVGMVYRQLLIEGRRIWSGPAVALPDRAEPGISGLLPVNLFRAVYVSNSERYAVLQ
jgi:hypothetical protein